MTRDEQLIFLNKEIARLDGVDEELANAAGEYEKECLQACVEVLERYKTIRSKLTESC